MMFLLRECIKLYTEPFLEFLLKNRLIYKKTKYLVLRHDLQREVSRLKGGWVVVVVVVQVSYTRYVVFYGQKKTN